MKNFLLIVVIFLAGCASNHDVKPNDPVIAPKTETVNIPTEQLTPCDDLEVPDLRALTQGQTLDLLAAWIKTYTSCKLSHNALIPTVKKAFNIQ